MCPQLLSALARSAMTGGFLRHLRRCGAHVHSTFRSSLLGSLNSLVLPLLESYLFMFCFLFYFCFLNRAEPSVSMVVGHKKTPLNTQRCIFAKRRPTLTGGSPQLPSALKSLTSVFGMGTGVTSSPSSPDLSYLFSKTVFIISILMIITSIFFMNVACSFKTG